MLSFIEKKDCTGCTACANACPVSCISMLADENGFEYPQITGDCIKCGKCERICPSKKGVSPSEKSLKQTAYAVVSRSLDTWLKSSSGGAFTEICKAVGDDDTVIFGAAFDGLRVIHKYVIGVDNIDELRKSKYVASSLSDTFKVTENYLKRGKKVIWCATPCQIAGLRNFLGQNYDNLLCIDFICHGVGSPKVFSDFLNFLSKKYGASIKKYTFRNKRIVDKTVTRHTSKYEFESGQEVFVTMDEYNQLFISQLCLRECCEGNCLYQNPVRMGDITIADFNSKHKVIPQKRWDYRNYSSVVINTDKGLKTFNAMKDNVEYFPCDLSQIEEYNPLFCKKAPGNPDSKKFFDDFTDNGLDYVLKKYTVPHKQHRLRLLTNRLSLKHYFIEIEKIFYNTLKKFINL